MTKLDWRCIDGVARIHGASTVASVGKRVFTLHFRIDGRGNKYRVDVEKPLVPAWEAIDGGEGFADLDAAKQHAEKWLVAAQQQENLTPRL